MTRVASVASFLPASASAATLAAAEPQVLSAPLRTHSESLDASYLVAPTGA